MMIKEVIDMLQEHYPIDDLLAKMDDFDRGKTVGHIEVIRSLERLLDDEEEIV